MVTNATAVIREGVTAFEESLTPREREITDILKNITQYYRESGVHLTFKYQRVEEVGVSYSKVAKDSIVSLEETVAVIVITPAGIIERFTRDDLSKRSIDAMVDLCLKNAEETNYGDVEKVKVDPVEPNIRAYNVEEGIPFDSMTFDEKVALFEDILTRTDVEEKYHQKKAKFEPWAGITPPLYKRILSAVKGTAISIGRMITRPKINFTGRITYREMEETRIIVNSDGSLVKDRRPLPNFFAFITGDKKGVKKDDHCRLNGIGGLEATIQNPDLFSGIEDSKNLIRELYNEITFEEYLKREGLDESILENANFVLAPGFFSTVMHEAFGHPLSEADKYVTGNSFACVDGKVNPMKVAVPGFSAAFVSGDTKNLCRGTRFVDDEGTHVKKIYVIKDGWVGVEGTELLHSRFTATNQGKTSKGTCVSYKGWHTPIPRQCAMTWEIDETKIPNYGSTEKELTIEEFYSIAQENPDKFFGKDHSKTVFFVDGSKGGEALSASGTFSLNSRHTYILRYSKMPVRLNPFTFKGSVKDFLKDNIEGVIGCKPNLSGGSCGRGQSYEKVQWNPNVTYGSHAVIMRYDKNKMTLSGTK